VKVGHPIVPGQDLVGEAVRDLGKPEGAGCRGVFFFMADDLLEPGGVGRGAVPEAEQAARQMAKLP
jgi:hypothetical protein